MTALAAALAVGVDLGKTGCRAVAAPLPLDAASWRTPAHDSPDWRAAFRHFVGTAVWGDGAGAPGLAEPDGAAAGVQAVVDVVAPLVGRSPVCGLVVGAAGGAAGPEAAYALAARLSERLDCPAGISTDAVTSHAGALSGRPGVVLAAGTGAVATGVAADGGVTVVDGWGQWLGDDGSGAWIGREALRAVLRARDGRGRATALTAVAEGRYGDPARLPRLLPLTPATVRATAAFVPDVVACAEAGDPEATRILERAGSLLAETTATAAGAVDSDGTVEVAVVGGLAAAGESLLATWRAGLPAGATLVPAEGSSAEGALLLAVREDLPHEAHVRRSQREVSR